MNIITRQIIVGTGLALALFLLVCGSVFFVFPLRDLRELWERNVLDIPFILFVPSVSIAAGILFGMMSGVYWKKQFQSVDDLLHQLEESRPLELDRALPEELTVITKRVANIQRQITEQTKLSQRIVKEAAEDHENRMQEIIFEERNRLARELHDSVSQQLFAASMLMSAITEAKPASDDRETNQLKMVESMIHQSQLEMRALLLHLRPVALKGKTLQEGVKELLLELKQKVTMDIEWKMEDFPVDKGIEDHLFRILQESVSNTLRHAKASQLEVFLVKRDGYIILRVSDDGVGFNQDENKAGSYGLQNMYERAREIGGNLKIISLPNQGTRLEVKIPNLMDGE
ncbi:sensor histidine kinase [Bacillus benzoevorans]|uniref:Sensor histidine kinase n=1 Tax=Bacillus benzoevorans TaxID=1456 RepID=A0A7X0HV17_9BACI|nr:sensor histidine kinase [Bacillus benzoevorans]MBB6447333.1 NarL family two-component system sensor histidine kinase LiaS [Bacillus benzoevorans]